MRFRHYFRHFQSGHLPQVFANQGFTNGLKPVRCAGVSLFLAHSNERGPLPRKNGQTVSLNHRRNVGFRQIFTPSEPLLVPLSLCIETVCDKYKSRQIVEITPLFIPIRGEHGPVRVLRLLRG